MTVYTKATVKIAENGVIIHPSPGDGDITALIEGGQYPLQELGEDGWNDYYKTLSGQIVVFAHYEAGPDIISTHESWADMVEETVRNLEVYLDLEGRSTPMTPEHEAWIADLRSKRLGKWKCDRGRWYYVKADPRGLGGNIPNH